MYVRAYHQPKKDKTNHLSPSQVLNELIEQSTQPKDATNIFSLIRAPTQEVIDLYGTNPPIEDFETGFRGQSDDVVHQFVQRLFAEGRGGGFLEKRWFAILDDKSTSQSAVLLYHGMKKSLWDKDHEDPEVDSTIPGEHKIRDDGFIWWQWRIPFRFAWAFFIDIEYCSEEVLELYSRPEYRALDGVIDAETCHKIVKAELPDPKGVV